MPAMTNGVAGPTPQEALQARLADPRTMDSLNRLLDRLDVIAFSVEMVDSFLRRGNEVADNLSAGVAELRAKEGGAADLLEKLPALARAGAKVADVADSPAFDRLLDSGLLERLSEPATLANLATLLDKLDLVVFTVNAIDGFWRRGDVVAESIAESVADLRKLRPPEAARLLDRLPQLAEAGVAMAEVSQTPEFANLIALARDLGKPETVAKVRLLLDKLDLAVFALTALDGFLRRGDQVAESVAEGVADLRRIASSVDAGELARIAAELPKLTDAGHKLVASGLLDKVAELAEAGMMLSAAGFFEPRTVRTLAEIGRQASESYNQAKAEPSKPYGLFDLVRVLKDPGVQRSVSLLVEMARRYGQRS